MSQFQNVKNLKCQKSKVSKIQSVKNTKCQKYKKPKIPKKFGKQGCKCSYNKFYIKYISADVKYWMSVSVCLCVCLTDLRPSQTCDYAHA